MDTRPDVSHPLATMKPVAPSALLPPARRALDLSSEGISSLVAQLSRIYTPQVLGTQLDASTPARPMKQQRKGRSSKQKNTLAPSFVDSGYASLVVSDDEDNDEITYQQSKALNQAVQSLAHASAPPSEPFEEQLSLLRSDTFERSYAMTWLTGLISRSEEWIEQADVDNEHELREQVVDRASALLAACSGSSASGALTRSFSFRPQYSLSKYCSQTPPPSPINIHLKDDSLPSSDHTAVGLQTWGSAPILAQLMAEDLKRFHLDLWDDTRRCLRSNKVLELGAGTGLLSLFTWKLFEQQLALAATISGEVADDDGTKDLSVLATDFHPSVLSNLTFNLGLNPPSSPIVSNHSATIDVRALDWNTCTPIDNEAERYDLVYGADVIYEKDHADLIKSVIEKVLKRPTPYSSATEGPPKHSSGGAFWLIYPQRPTHDAETASMERVFGGVVDKTRWSVNVAAQETRNEMWELGVLDFQSLERRKGIGRADEVNYRVLKVGWVAR